MAMVTRSTFYFNSCSYSQSYSSPSVISPINLPFHSYNNHDSNQRTSCCSLLTSSNNDSTRRRGDHHSNKLNHKSRFCMYGYGFGYSTIHGLGYNRYQVRQASKQVRSEGNYEEEGYKREEVRWLREEQRWLREEQRWLREEDRWKAERDSLLREISHLNLKIQDLELEIEGLRNRVGSASTVPETLGRITALLQVLSAASTSSNSNANQNQIPENSEETSKPLVLEHNQPELESKSESHTPIPHASAAVTSLESKKKTKLSLKMGSEGEEVQALQEALLSLGFYSGEEDMEYSSFSSGTQRAVKTWQASIGAPENGVMTAELLELLYAAQRAQNSEAVNAIQDLTIQKQDISNGIPAASVKEVKEVQRTVVKKGPSEVDISQHRVFLLGENRWEDPSRISKGNDKQAKGITNPVSAMRCIVCRGEGRILCMECDGTGEANVEEQFLDWVEEGAKCPYCEGLGYSTCDVCEGKAVA